MKKNSILITAAILLFCGCAKVRTQGVNDANVRYFEAWLQKNHPDLVGKKVFPGIYIISDVPGDGELVGPAIINPYIRANYRISDLEGNIISSSYEMDARKMRGYSETYYYGPYVFERANNAMYAGIDYAITDMNVGGIREFIIPGWLMTLERYEDESGYIENVTGSDCIYTMEITEKISDIDAWEQDSVSRYVQKAFPGASLDSVGFYRKQINMPKPGESFDNDTTIYINYVGRRLDGVVFDTNIADTAKVHGIFSTNKTYAPTLINWTKKYDGITMTSDKTSVIPGFSFLLSKMGPYEKAVAVFTSQMGYSSSGSGFAIPSYSPLQFEVEIVDKE